MFFIKNKWEINLNDKKEFEIDEDCIQIYTEPKWKCYTVIIQIANTISNQFISLCLFKIGHITKAIIGLKLEFI